MHEAFQTPSKWPSVSLGEILIEQKQRIGSPDANGLPLLGVSNKEGLQQSTKPRIDDMSRYLCVQRDWFAYNPMRINVGSIGWAETEAQTGVISPDYVVFSCTARVEPRFIYLFLKHERGLRAIGLETAGSVRERLYFQSLSRIQLALPPLAEQRRIIAFIDNIAAKLMKARTLRTQSRAELDLLLEAARASSFQDIGPTYSLGDVAHIIDPNPSHRYPAYVSDGIPIISSSEFVGEESLSWGNARHVPLEFYQETLGRYRVGDGDLLFSRKGKIGYARLHPANIRLAMTHTLCVIKPNVQRLDSRYLLHFARSRTFLTDLAKTMNPNVGVPTLGLTVLRSASIPVPPLEQQREIVKYLDGLQEASNVVIGLQNQTAAELEALLPAVLNQALCGAL